MFLKQDLGHGQEFIAEMTTKLVALVGCFFISMLEHDSGVTELVVPVQV